jgi:hypothetical protein
MLFLPSAAEPLLMSFSIAFTEPTFQRFLPLVVGAVLARGRRTVTAMLRAAPGVARGHSSTYHRVFSRAAWSLWPLGRVLAQAVLQWVDPTRPIRIIVDDTTAGHRGKHVYGKGRHHDAVRSTHTHTVWRWGHKWVVLAVSVPFPFTSRRWALPVLVALYRPETLNRAEGRRHKTPPQLARQLMAVLIHWFPARRFILLGDGGYASHELARFCHRHRRHVMLVSRFYKDANLYRPPPTRRPGRPGRPRTKGAKRPTPLEVVATRSLTRATVSWYGGGTRRIRWTSGTGHWYKSGRGLVPVRWVYVKDVQGTHRDEWFFTTDPTLRGPEIISLFTARWAIETTFQEMRAHLGLETTRQRVAKSVLRTGPCLLGLFSLVSLVFAEHTRHHRVRVRDATWYAKTEPTFSDAIATVRRLFWLETILKRPTHRAAFAKLPPRVRNLLLDGLTLAA